MKFFQAIQDTIAQAVLPRTGYLKYKSDVTRERNNQARQEAKVRREGELEAEQKADSRRRDYDTF